MQDKKLKKIIKPYVKKCHCKEWHFIVRNQRKEEVYEEIIKHVGFLK